MNKIDIKLKSENGLFKYRVSGALIVDDKLLTVQIMHNGFYCLPGGHISLGEMSSDAILREFKEETGLEVVINRKIAVVENIFKRSDETIVHELGIYYRLNDINGIKPNDWVVIEEDDGVSKELEFKWININELDNYNFKPEFIKDLIKENKENIILEIQ